jgi:anti-sigma factor RsiW
MTRGASEPTREELLAMAYADGELSGTEREEFERVLERRADLRELVARELRLDVLARASAGPEPMDLEWRAMDAEPLHRATLGVGLTLVLAGLALGAFGLLYFLWASALPRAVPIGVTAAMAGATVLGARALRARLRTQALDPYTEIRR